MRKTKPGLNVLLALTYGLLIVGVLAIFTLSVTTYLSRYLLNARAKAQEKALDRCALALSPYLEESNPNDLYGILYACAIEQNGRMLLLDNRGTVQVDTFCSLNGTVPYCEEIEAVLQGKNDHAYGYHRLYLEDSAITRGNDYLTKTSGAYWAAYYACTVLASGQEEGVLLLVSPVQDIADDINAAVTSLVVFGGIFTLAIAGITLYISNIMTRSLRRFNRAIARMSGGDFSVRVDEGDIAEFGELATAFNMMSARLESLDDARNQFVSDASHELKTPMASMKILSESLLEQPDTPVEMYREFMQDINHEIDRLTLVINDLLTLVKTDRGSETLVLAPTELADVLKDVTVNVSPLALRRHITVSYSQCAVTVMGDELRLQQAFTNLVDNAIKYSPDHTTVSVTLAQNGNRAVVTVADQGIGIAPDDLQHLFERFYRVDKARSRKAGGTGLGLSIVKQIIDQHRGTIEVSSEPGKGTTFTVTLPLMQKETEV